MMNCVNDILRVRRQLGELVVTMVTVTADDRYYSNIYCYHGNSRRKIP